MSDRLWLEDMMLGRRFEFGTCTVDRDEVVAFATRYDPQPYHIDEEAARNNPIFGRLSASGVHTFAMASRMIFEGFADHHIVAIGGGGLDELRLSFPVYPGDILRLDSEVVEARVLASRPDRGLVRMRNRAVNQDGKDVITFIGTLFIECRPTGTGEQGGRC